MSQNHLNEKRDGFSVITCTKRQKYINNLFNNYRRQILEKKELIIILNNDKMEIKKYSKKAKKYGNVYVYQLAEKNSLGACLNYGVSKTKYKFVAKFDDDDFYAPAYLEDYIKVFKKTGADVIGKRAHFMWLSGKKVLILRNSNSENKFVSTLPGATLAFNKRIFKKVRFANRSIGEDDQFCRDSSRLGFKVYSTGKWNFVAVRRKNSKGHTWIVSDKDLLSRHVKVIHGVHSFRAFITRSTES